MNTENKILKYFKSLEGKTMDQTPSQAVNWLKGTLVWMEHGSAKVSYEVVEQMCNPAKILHGGIASLMMDEVIGLANIALGGEYLMTSINLNVDFLASAQVGDQIEVEAKLVRSGSNLNHWECSIKKNDGKIVAKSASNMIKTHIKLKDLGFKDRIY